MERSDEHTPLPAGSGWLIGLLLTTFVIGTDDFIIAGILPAVSGDLEVSEAVAGRLATVFSVVYALAAPVLALVVRRMPRRTLIVGGLSVFAVINLVTALAPHYAVLMVLRVLAAGVVVGLVTIAVMAFAVPRYPTAGAPARHQPGRIGTSAAT
ncbi:MFS transporter [Streptomyces sp. XM4011]|uniref:MFS transporter n=1 Tax=Streptomyces sp. XM4011 TaxID=2929780 RepID=UPI001FF8A7DC|nr:MFS transporter [Streptomyces sp. XM4011]MCK1815689.1 MFS transporter [Streptomyces sp. XM4011]